MLCPKCGNNMSEGDLLCCECGYQPTMESTNKLSKLGSLTLESDSITQSCSQVGKEFYMHIFLKDISSIQRGYKSYPIFSVLAIVSLLVGATASLGGNDSFWIVLGLILFFVFICCFITTIEHVLIITARGGEKMIEKLKGSWNVEEFVEKIIYLKRHK